MIGYAVLAEWALKVDLGHGIAPIVAKIVSANGLRSIAKALRKGVSEAQTSVRTAAKNTLLRVEHRNTVRNVRRLCTKSLTPNNLLNIIIKTRILLILSATLKGAHQTLAALYAATTSSVWAEQKPVPPAAKSIKIAIGEAYTERDMQRNKKELTKQIQVLRK